MPYARHLLGQLAVREGVEVHLIVSRGAHRVYAREGGDPTELTAHADVVYNPDDLGAAPASGSFPTAGMVVVPASATTVGKLAAGIADNLLLRAAYVHLKERRPLVVVPREAPLPEVTLEALLKLARAGAVVLPASPGFYHRPETIEDLLGFVSQRILDHLGLEGAGARWGG
ncbi:UbiX family flavin prenyltransferase [Deinococcota bacterium DY0809b]